MTRHAHQYAASARAGMSPREIEASALLKAAAQLQQASDKGQHGSPAFEAALTHNRRLWTVILTSVAREDCPLTPVLRTAILTLGNFVLNETIAALARPGESRLPRLIDINRELAAGLRGQA